MFALYLDPQTEAESFNRWNAACAVKPFEHATTRLAVSFIFCFAHFLFDRLTLHVHFLFYSLLEASYNLFFLVENGHSDVTLAQNPIVNLPGICMNSAYISAKNEMKSH